MSAFTRPLLALPNGQAQLLERIPLTIGGSDKDVRAMATGGHTHSHLIAVGCADDVNLDYWSC